MEKKVRVTGLGGQGIVTAGFILGKAVSIFDDKYSTFVQSYGPEARGSACSSQVVVSDDPILYPYITKQNYLIAMSQEGYDKFINKTEDNGIVIIDEDLVDPGTIPNKIQLYRVPATRFAEKKLKKRIVANIILLGYLVKLTQVVTEHAIEEAVLSMAPRGTEKLNADALSLGLKFKPAK